MPAHERVDQAGSTPKQGRGVIHIKQKRAPVGKRNKPWIPWDPTAFISFCHPAVAQRH